MKRYEIYILALFFLMGCTGDYGSRQHGGPPSGRSHGHVKNTGYAPTAEEAMFMGFQDIESFSEEAFDCKVSIPKNHGRINLNLVLKVINVKTNEEIGQPLRYRSGSIVFYNHACSSGDVNVFLALDDKSKLVYEVIHPVGERTAYVKGRFDRRLFMKTVSDHLRELRKMPYGVVTIKRGIHIERDLWEETRPHKYRR